MSAAPVPLRRGTRTRPVPHRTTTPVILILGSIILILTLTAALSDPRLAPLAAGWGLGAISSGMFFGAMVRDVSAPPGRHARNVRR